MKRPADPALFSSRWFDAAGWVFRVRSSESAICEWAELAFADLSSTTSTTGDNIGLFFDGVQYVLHPPTGEKRLIGLRVSDAIVHLVNQASLAHGAERLHVHAAGLGRSGKALLMAGPSGTGKTTLTAKLCQLGWEYLTDEACAISTTDTAVSGFPKPLSLKAGSVNMLPDVAANGVRLDGEMLDGRCLVPASRLGATPVEQLTGGMVVLLRRDRSQPTPEPVIESLHPADLTVHLVEQAMDFDRFPDSGLACLAELAARSWCGVVDIADPAFTASALEEVHDRSELPTPPIVERLHRAHSDRPDRVRDTVTSVGIGDAIVVQDSVSRAVFSLHDQAAGIWHQLLEGNEPTSDGASPAFVGQLHEIGVLGQ